MQDVLYRMDTCKLRLPSLAYYERFLTSMCSHDPNQYLNFTPVAAVRSRSMPRGHLCLSW
jgi:hypothetical protein